MSAPVRPPTVEAVGRIDSTNAEARRRATAGQRGPVWLRADSQTGGMGRSGRAWSSPPGNLYATLLMPFERPANEAALMSFAACLAVADTLDAYAAPGRISLKWPNDALLDGKKIAGVLLEAGGADGARWLSIGVGLNLASKPVEARLSPISLADIGPAPAPEEAMATLAAALDARIRVFETEGFAPIRSAWLARAARLNQTIEARFPRETVSGRFDGIAEDGALLLGVGAGQTRISAADIHFPEV